MPEDRKTILSTAYLAPIPYYAVLVNAGKIWIECHDNYEKQTYRNRCRIASANGVMDLTVPVEKSEKGKQKVCDARISAHTDWQKNHWRAIEAAYNSSPFFEYYKDDLLPFYTKKWSFLIDFNEQIQSKMLELLDWKADIDFTQHYTEKYDDTFTDLRDAFHPKKSDSDLNDKIYYQVFALKNGFVPNLSIIDLLFNMGNEAVLLLLQKQ